MRAGSREPLKAVRPSLVVMPMYGRRLTYEDNVSESSKLLKPIVLPSVVVIQIYISFLFELTSSISKYVGTVYIIKGTTLGEEI